MQLNTIFLTLNTPIDSAFSPRLRSRFKAMLLAYTKHTVCLDWNFLLNNIIVILTQDFRY